MSNRAVTALAAIAILGTMCVSTDALARVAGARPGGAGAGRANVNVNRNVTVNRGVGYRGVGYGAAAVGAAAVGAAAGAAAAGAAGCGYFPYPPCY